MNTVHHTEHVVKQARAFFDSWLGRFPTWADFVQALSEESLPFGASRDNTIPQITDWLGGAAEAGVLDAELSVMALRDYDMLCCMIDENLTQQHVSPKTIVEIVAAAIKEAEKMLRSTTTVHEFNALFKRSRGLPTLLQKSVRLVPDGRNSDWAPEEYTRAKLAIEPSGDGLGKDFIRHFLPKNSVANNNTLQAAITAYYQEYWQQEGDRLLEQSRLELWKGQESNDAELIAAALELEKLAVSNPTRAREHHSRRVIELPSPI